MAGSTAAPFGTLPPALGFASGKAASNNVAETITRSGSHFGAARVVANHARVFKAQSVYQIQRFITGVP